MRSVCLDRNRAAQPSQETRPDNPVNGRSLPHKLPFCKVIARRAFGILGCRRGRAANRQSEPRDALAVVRAVKGDGRHLGSAKDVPVVALPSFQSHFGGRGGDGFGLSPLTTKDMGKSKVMEVTPLYTKSATVVLVCLGLLSGCGGQSGATSVVTSTRTVQVVAGRDACFSAIDALFAYGDHMSDAARAGLAGNYGRGSSEARAASRSLDGVRPLLRECGYYGAR